MSRPKGSRNKIQKQRLCRCGKPTREYYINGYPSSKYSNICSSPLCNLSRLNGFKKGHKLGIGKKYLLGRKLTLEHRRKISEKLKINNPMKKLENKLKISALTSGYKSHWWKGGLTDINKRIKSSNKYKEWRERIFKRDNWTCQECRIKGVELHPHHLKPFSKFPELRFELSNGQTLCKDCHRKTDSYGSKIKTYAISS